MAHEIGLGLSWLLSTLGGDATLASLAPGGVWTEMAPPGIATPFVIVAWQAGTDVTTMNAVRIFSHVVYQARANGPASASTAIVNAADRIDALIDGKSGTPSGGLVLSCSRDAPLSLPELVAGEQWTSFGGLYRLLIRSN